MKPKSRILKLIESSRRDLKEVTYGKKKYVSVDELFDDIRQGKVRAKISMRKKEKGHVIKKIKAFLYMLPLYAILLVAVTGGVSFLSITFPPATFLEALVLLGVIFPLVLFLGLVMWLKGHDLWTGH